MTARVERLISGQNTVRLPAEPNGHIVIDGRKIPITDPKDIWVVYYIFGRVEPEKFLPLDSLNRALAQSRMAPYSGEDIQRLTQICSPALQAAGPEQKPHVWTDSIIEFTVEPSVQDTPSDKNTEITPEIIARAQARDEEAFQTVFCTFERDIYNYIYRTLSGSKEDARDLTQDTFLKVFLSLDKYTHVDHLKAWIYKIATNVCLDELRHRKLIKWQPWDAFISVFHPSQVAKDNPEREYFQMENAEEIQLILSKLHPRHRMCLILREYHDLSYYEIADILNISFTAVKSLLYRAREEFRQVYSISKRQPANSSLMVDNLHSP